jgi:hypothetical protein
MNIKVKTDEYRIQRIQIPKNETTNDRKRYIPQPDTIQPQTQAARRATQLILFRVGSDVDDAQLALDAFPSARVSFDAGTVVRFLVVRDGRGRQGRDGRREERGRRVSFGRDDGGCQGDGRFDRVAREGAGARRFDVRRSELVVDARSGNPVGGLDFGVCTEVGIVA